MRTLIMATAVAAAVATLGATTLPSWSADSVGSGGTTLRLVGHATHDEQVDGGPPGFSVGDQAIERGILTQDGQTVGHYAMLAELVRLPAAHRPPAESQTFTLKLEHGSVVATRIHSAVNSFVLAVTGGTGAYREASGVVSVRARGRRAVIELDLD